MSEQYTGVYSHHAFYTQQWNGSDWVTVSNSDIAGEAEGNYQSSTNHGGFRWAKPADFLLTEVGTNSNPVNSYDGVGRTGAENALTPAQAGTVTLSTLYDFDTPVTKDLTLYAKWTEKDSVLIHYTTDEGGSLSRTEETLPPVTGTAAGSTVSVSAGYTFEGWFDEAD